MSFFGELKRRNVFRVCAAYLAVAWLIIQVVETLFPVFGLSNDAVRIVVIMLAIGFVPAAVLAWVFEWTPEGLRRDSMSRESAASSRQMTRRIDRMIIVALTLAVALLLVDKVMVRDTPPGAWVGSESIAVLPCTDLSEQHDQAYFADGIAESILGLLARYKGMRVISRSSAFAGADHRQHRGPRRHREDPRSHQAPRCRLNPRPARATCFLRGRFAVAPIDPAPSGAV